MNVKIASRPNDCFHTTITIPIVIKYIDDNPAANPSNPSIRFMQFIIATINNIVII